MKAFSGCECRRKEGCRGAESVVGMTKSQDVAGEGSAALMPEEREEPSLRRLLAVR